MTNDNQDFQLPSPTPEKKSSDEIFKEHCIELADTFQRINPKLREMFIASIRVLQELDEPYRLSLSAHGIREIIDKLPDYLDVKASELKSKRGDKRSQLLSYVKKKIKASKCSKKKKWEGETIDKPLSDAISKIEQHLDWEKKHKTNRVEDITKYLDELDGSIIPLPKALKKASADYISKIKDYFVKVTHNKEYEDLEEYKMWLSAFVRFFREKRGVDVIQGINSLDIYIREGESDD